MLIRIKRHFCLRPHEDVAPGDVVEATRSEALRAFALDRAELTEPDQPAAADSAQTTARRRRR